MEGIVTSWALLAFSSAIGSGFLLLYVLWPARPFVRSQLGLTLSLAVGIGLGVSSCTFFLALVLFGGGRHGAAVLDATLLVLVLALSFLVPSTRWMPPRSSAALTAATRPAIRWTLGATLVAALSAATARVLVVVLQQPHGGWDAWAVWNLRARFLFRGGAQWRDAFAPQLAWSHPDYPLLIPGCVARVWTYLQADTVLVPISVSLLFGLATVGLTYAALALLRSRTQGLLAAVCLLASTGFARSAAEQYADVPTAYFFLATLVLLACHDRFAPAHPGFLVCAGITAGLAAWTKNEGMLFLVVIIVVRTAVIRFARLSLRRQLLPFALGAAPVLAVIFFFKSAVAPGSELLSEHGWATVAKLTDAARYVQVARTFAEKCIQFGGGAVILLLLYRLLVGRTPDRESRRPAAAVGAALVLMVAGFFMVYIVTPYGLSWHLTNSLDRLLLQLWPSVIFVTFLTATGVEEIAPHKVPPVPHASGARPAETGMIDHTSPLPGR